MTKRRDVRSILGDVGASIAPQLGGLASVAERLFGFSRSTQLRSTFPQSGAEILTPGVVDPAVKLVHPFAGGLANYQPVGVFTLTGSAGSDVVTGSEIPSGNVFVFLAGLMFHSDGAAQHHLSFQLDQVALGQAIDVQSSRSDPTSVFLGVTGVPANIEYTLRPVIVPPGWRLRGKAFGLGGVDTVSLKGMGMLVPLSEEPPALWPR